MRSNHLIKHMSIREVRPCGYVSQSAGSMLLRARSGCIAQMQTDVGPAVSTNESWRLQLYATLSGEEGGGQD